MKIRKGEQISTYKGEGARGPQEEAEDEQAEDRDGRWGAQVRRGTGLGPGGLTSFLTAKRDKVAHIPCWFPVPLYTAL